jgi:hypothetical protein
MISAEFRTWRPLAGFKCPLTGGINNSCIDGVKAKSCDSLTVRSDINACIRKVDASGFWVFDCKTRFS